MENLNAEMIKKALECCTSESSKCADCPRYSFVPCTKSLLTDALSLIKELTEENERLRAVIDKKEETMQMIAQEKQVYCDKLVIAKEDIARLRDTAYRLECEVHRERADTVRQMQEEIKKTLSALCKGDVSEICRMVDQIAKEMLEGE